VAEAISGPFPSRHRQRTGSIATGTPGSVEILLRIEHRRGNQLLPAPGRVFLLRFFPPVPEILTSAPQLTFRLFCIAFGRLRRSVGVSSGLMSRETVTALIALT
jgi:hypothetical protein